MFPFSRKFLLFVALPFALLSARSEVLCEEEPYRIGREDVLEISVWQTPDLTKTVTVNRKGTIPYPFIGDLFVAGKTPQEVESLLRGKLSQGYLKDPKLSVTVKEYNSKKVLVFGEVSQPGLYKLKGKIPLLELLFMVRGVKTDAKRMTVIRSSHAVNDPDPSVFETHTRKSRKASTPRAIEVNLIALLAKGDLSQNITILPGDTIYVSSGTGEKFYVLGQVKAPGPYEWVQEISVLEAIKLAGGTTETAALTRIRIRRAGASEKDMMKINMMDIMKGKKKDDVMVKPGDVIIVPESWI